MPRDNDKNNGPSRGRPPGRSGGASSGKGRSGAARGPEKKFAKKAGNYVARPESAAGERKSFGAKPFGAKSFGAKPYAGKRDDARPPRRDFSDSPRPARGGARPDRGPRKEFSPRDGGGDKRPYTPRDGGGDKRPYTPRSDRGEARGEGRPPARFGGDKKFGDKRPYTPRDGGGEKRPYSPREGDKRPYTPRGEGFGDRPRPSGDRPFGARPSRDSDKKFGGERKFGRGAPDRGPRKDFGSRPDRGQDRGQDRGYDRGPDRGETKPWQKRDASSPDHEGRNSRPSRDGERSFDRPRFDKPREERAERPRFSRPREDRPERSGGDRPFRERPTFDRPREDRGDWHEHPRNDAGAERPRRDNEDDSKVFAKRPAFGGRGAYRERKPDFEKRAARPPKEKKAGERIAKVVSRAGLCSRRDAEAWITQGRVSVNGRQINSPALDVTVNDVITVDNKPLPARERTRLFLFHKPRGLMTTHADPEGRPTVFDNLPEGLPRLISIGRLDFNTEGLLLLTNDGGLARALELPDTGWLRRYRVRAHGEVTQGQLDELQKGVEVDGVKYGEIDAKLERDQGANVWLVFAIREGKNREVRNVLAHLGLEVNRLIRVSYGPFQLGELPEGEVEEVKTRVLREQLGEKIAALAGADFGRPTASKGDTDLDPVVVKKPVFKRGAVEDRKGRRVLVQRTGSDEARARNESEANGYGPPRRPTRGYHGKRDLTPRDE
ncbi:pseudouridine synthase [Rhodopseudomonas sp. BAL398]|uniref:pseudouridine synthase n=1 Tax=Rhodopseudomonas sp. BAL398 TaxID=3034676 RepID=UPI0023E22E59|nr:pseudouridine synthase [Rhodopseudomonas sp. BAL398]MDF3812269.1 pseudouridine synthase [Rhodopseudomonas sp. BAL398]